MGAINNDNHVKQLRKEVMVSDQDVLLHSTDKDKKR